jgi:hypothetical protein
MVVSFNSLIFPGYLPTFTAIRALRGNVRANDNGAKMAVNEVAASSFKNFLLSIRYLSIW